MQNCCIGFIIFAKRFVAPQKRGVKNDLFPKGKIGGDEAIFVRYAVAESAA